MNLFDFKLWAISKKRNRFILPKIISCLVLTLIIVSGVWVHNSFAAPVIPEPASDLYVLDQANVISSQTEAMIISTSRELNRLTKAQVAVVTLNTLDDQPIEDVALGILRQWKLGDKQLNNGLLIVVVPSERRSRIEVGYGLEGVLPDAKTGRIQDEYMLPAFKAGNYDKGISDSYQVIVGEIANEYNVKVNITNNSTPVAVGEKGSVPTVFKILGLIGLLILLWIDHRFFNGFFLGFLLGILFRGGGGGIGGGRGDSGGGGSGGGGGSSRGW